MGTWTKEEAAASLRQLEELGAEAKRLSAVPLTEKESRRVRSRLAARSTALPEVIRGDFNVTIQMKGNRWRLLMALLKPCDAITLSFNDTKMEVSGKPQ